MTLGLCWSLSGPALADERRPLDALPYTPGLDVTAMDTGANACEDFFQYSCGGWIRRNPIPPDKSSWDVYSKLNEENLQYLWGILEQASDPTRPRDAVQKQIGDYFAACMDTGEIEARGLGPLAPALAAISALASREDLPALIARLHGGMSNGDILFGYTSLQDFEDSQTFIGTFFSGGIGLPERDYYLSDDGKMRETRDRYRQHVARMFTLIGRSPEDAARAARHVLAIETRLAAATLPPVDQQDPTKLNHPVAAEGLQADAPGELESTALVDLLRSADGRVHNEDLLPRNAGVLHRFEATYGASPLRLRTYEALYDGLGATDEARLWQLLAVDTVLGTRSELPTPTLAPSQTVAAGGVLHRLASPPRAWLASRVEVAADPNDALRRLAAPELDPHQTVVFLAAEGIAAASVPPTGRQIEVLRRSPGEIELAVGAQVPRDGRVRARPRYGAGVGVGAGGWGASCAQPGIEHAADSRTNSVTPETHPETFTEPPPAGPLIARFETTRPLPRCRSGHD